MGDLNGSDPFADYYVTPDYSTPDTGGSMIDLNNPDTYSIQDYGGGNVLYTDASTGLTYDPSDLSNPLSASALAAYGAPAGAGAAISTGAGTTTTQSTFHSPSPAPTLNSGSQGGTGTAGLTGLFSAVGGAFASVINPPKTTTPGGQPLVYNAALGTYVPASATGAALTNISSTPMWVVIGILVVVGLIAFTVVEKK